MTYLVHLHLSFLKRSPKRCWHIQNRKLWAKWYFFIWQILSQICRSCWKWLTYINNFELIVTLLLEHSDGLGDFQPKTDTILNFYTQQEACGWTKSDENLESTSFSLFCWENWQINGGPEKICCEKIRCDGHCSELFLCDIQGSVDQQPMEPPTPPNITKHIL